MVNQLPAVTGQWGLKTAKQRGRSDEVFGRDNQYESFAGRDLSEFKILYLFVDGIAERLHLGQPREAVLVAWAILEDGKKALVHVSSGTK